MVMLTMSAISHMCGGRWGWSVGARVTDKLEMLLRYYLSLITARECWQFLIHYNNKRFNFASIFQSGRSMRR